MAVAVDQHISGAGGGFSDKYSGGATPLTVSSNPTGKTLLARFTQVRSGIKGISVAGCGGTWVKIANSADTDESVQYWMNTTATTTGTVEITFSGGFTWATGAVTVISGLTAATVLSSTDTNNDSGSDVGPSRTGDNGQFVSTAGHSAHMTAYAGSSPATGWTSDTVVTAATGTKSGQSYRIPTASASHAATASNSNSTTGRHLIVVLGDALTPPGTPTNLDEIHTADTATLSWDASTGSVDGYEVRIDGGTPVDVGDVLEHEFTGLTGGTTYDLEVRAYGPGGDSGWALIEATTDNPPDPPTGLDETHDSDSAVLSWAAPTTGPTPAGYHVRINGGAPIDVGDVLSHEFTDLTSGATYTLEVRSYV